MFYFSGRYLEPFGVDHFNSLYNLYRIVSPQQPVSGNSPSPNANRWLAGVLLPETSHDRRASCHATLLDRTAK